MAEQQTPTFKLVLVGDGGTGKVRFIRQCALGRIRDALIAGPPLPRLSDLLPQRRVSYHDEPIELTRITRADHLRQASLDW